MAKSQLQNHPRASRLPATIPDPPPAAYVPKAAEIAAIDRLRQRLQAKPTPPGYKVAVTPAGVTELTADHADPDITLALLVDTMCTASEVLATGLRDQIVQFSRTGKDHKSGEINFALAAVQGIGPRDETEALLAVQMVAVHTAIAVAARRLNHCENIPQQDSASNMLTKLARVFATQMDTLKRYRSAGEQTIRVERVIVNDGGQAIVGNVAPGGGASHAIYHQPLEPEATGRPTPASGPALLCDLEAVSPAVPSAGGERVDRLPLPRRRRRSTERSS